LTQFEEALIGLERLDNYLRKPLEAGSRLPQETQFQTGHFTMQGEAFKVSYQKNASLRFCDVSFRYREDLPWVLKNISFEVKPGEKIGLVGRTGSGKSSLIQALFYLYPIQSGEIFINGISPVIDRLPNNEMGLEEFRSQISLISQDPVLFQGTLQENLDPSHALQDNQLYQVLTKVGLLEWVQAHPHKLKMKIEERGKNLSLGERQLLCMARCLLQDSPIVVMDEATSSVDPQSEEIMVKATEEFFKDRTQIIIAHRLSTLEMCDRILWLDQGEIKMLGPTQEVLEKFHENADLLN
jgi:ABC-type multidrug transport system fused ATPase/permease subunit